MAVFYVDEIKSQIAGCTGCPMKVLDDAGDLFVRQQRRIRRKPNLRIENRMMIENPGFWPIVSVRATVAA
jgi:hypothetical protein